MAYHSSLCSLTLLTVSLSSRAAAVSSLLRYRTTVLALKATHWSRPESALRTPVLPLALRSRHARAPDHSSSTSHLPGASHVARHVARAGAWSAALSSAVSSACAFPQRVSYITATRHFNGDPGVCFIGTAPGSSLTLPFGSPNRAVQLAPLAPKVECQNQHHSSKCDETKLNN